MNRLIAKKWIIFVLSSLLIISFFMPWIEFLIPVRAIDLFSGKVAKLIQSPWKYLTLVFPFIAITLILFICLTQGKTLISEKVLLRIPGVLMIGMIIRILLKLQASNRGLSPSSLNSLIDILRSGFWITLFSSLLLFVLSFVPSKKMKHLVPLFQSEHVKGD